LPDIQQCVSVLPSDSTSVNKALTDLKQNGLTVKFLFAAKENQKIQVAVQNYLNSVKLKGEEKPSLMEAVYRYNGRKPRIQRVMNIPSNLPDNGGGGGWNCQTDGASLFFLGLAFATLTVMTMGSDAILVGAAWAGISTYGGLATTGWGIGHVMNCGF
jgi:hypothetical protein